MKIDILTLFPNMFTGFLTESIIKRAIENNKVEINIYDIRDYSKDPHKKVDDYGFGGGDGMVLMPQPIFDAVRSLKRGDSHVILLTPQGTPYHQSKAHELLNYKHIIMVCGHYEGFDERIRDYVDIQMSLGDFVLTGGESACMVMCDCILRILPGVIRQDSSDDDSFSNGLLEYPQYTRPEVYNGKRVPDVLLSGHHANIKKYRHEESLKRTALYRPDLLENLELDKEDQKVVDTVLKNKN